MVSINKDLQKYIEQNIFPSYSKNESGHNLEHIKYVIRRSFKFAEELPDINYDMVYVIAAYHDIGHFIDPKTHEKISGDMLLADKNLKQFFTDEQIKIMAEAVYDHRASALHNPRSIYGKIVSTADRYNTVESCLKASYTYGKKLEPEATDEQLFERAYIHLKDKFGANGYAKFYFKDVEYEQFLKEIRNLLSDKDNYINIQREYINNLKNEGRL